MSYTDETDQTAVAPATPPAAPNAGQDVSRASDTPFVAAGAHKQHRTTGLRMFDVFLYPFLTNFVVFGISVCATYLTNKGGRNAAGKLPYGKVGEFFHTRGEWLAGLFKKTGMSEDQAQMSKMVFFSFADGTLVAPLVKIFEDRREKIAHWIDDRLGTTPADHSVYDAEPKQSWASVISGRLATSMIVVPTAVLLDRMKLNDKLFYEPGKKLGRWIASKPNLAKRFGSLDLPELFRTGIFEAFYTTVCTGGIYFLSRAFASVWGHEKSERDTAAHAAREHRAPPLAQPTPAPAIAPSNTDESRPSTHIAHAALQERVTQPAHGHEVTA